MRPARALTLETYHSFFVDPWNTRITVDELNQIVYMHGFAKFHHRKPNNKPKKAKIMELVVGQVDLMPPRRSTLHCAAPSVASPPSAAVITAAQARDDVEAIGWVECPIGSVAAFAAPSADAPEPDPAERVPGGPGPADFVLAGRRPRSKRTRGSAYGPRDVAAASMKSKTGVSAPRKQAKVVVEEEEREPELESSPPPPPLWTRSPTPPPPTSPPPPQDVAPPPQPPPPCQPQPTLAPIPAPPVWGTPMVLPHPSQQLFWGLPLPSRPTAQPCPAPPPPPGWSGPTPPPSFPAPFWGAPIMLPPLPPHVAWRWPPTTAPHPPMQLQRSPPPPLLLQHPPTHFQGPPLPGLVQTPPPPLLLHQPPRPHLQGPPLPVLLPTPPPPTLQHYPPPHFGFGGQHPPPALHQLPPPMQPQRPPSH